MDAIIQFLRELDPMWLYIVAFSVAYIENIFPPFPSDVIVAFIGSLIGMGTISLYPAIFLTTLGSTAGFVTMYFIGSWFGHRILEQNKIKFIPIESVVKVEIWFRRYGWGLIVANRFLSGTRAVVSFFAGLSELSLPLTTLLSFVSALVWNSILIYGGSKLGNNWTVISEYAAQYSRIVTIALVVVVLFFVVRYIRKRKSNSNNK
jgi:membrane protein DedA with SNARE-associated domain